jgi:uncharacterized protein (TIGR02246 family)
MTNQVALALVNRQAQAWQRNDVETILADFADDALFISPGGRWCGREQIGAAARDFFREAADIQIGVTRVVCDGDQCAVEWTWRETRLIDGSQHSADDAIIFTLQNGKIVYWREYIHWHGPKVAGA